MKLSIFLVGVTVIWAGAATACTVQTEDDSVPGNGHGWAGLYYILTPLTGMVEDGISVPFVAGTEMVNHGFTLEGTVGFCNDFYIKADVPYSLDYYESEIEDVQDMSSGLGDIAVAGKWAFLNSDQGPRAAVLLGASMPSGDEDDGYGSGVVIPKVTAVAGLPLGPGRFCAGVGYAYIPAKDDVDAGDILSYHAVYDWKLGAGVTIPLEIIGYVSVQDSIDGRKSETSGSHFLTISPGITYTIRERVTICGGVMVPVFKDGWGYDYDYQPHATLFLNF